MAFAKHSLEELDRIICDEVNIDYDDYKKMTPSEQFKVREQYREQQQTNNTK